MTGARNSYDLAEPIRDLSWTVAAKCAGDKAWLKLSTREQIAACEDCPAIVTCREFAVSMYRGRLKSAMEDRTVYGGWAPDELVSAVREASHV